jgi:pimeloyl-ACP methyl ester carboxylesterase
LDSGQSVGGGEGPLSAPPKTLRTLVERFDAGAFDAPNGRARIRLEVSGDRSWDTLVEGTSARLAPAAGSGADAVLTADRATWSRIAADLRSGMEAFRSGRLAIRRNLHLGLGLLAATTGSTDPGRLRFERVRTSAGAMSTLQAGTGEPVLMLHGLGATKASFLSTIAALADRYRTIAIDLPGFGDSDKPLRAPYDARYFASSVVSLLDSLGHERAHLIGNSMGGRVAIEVGLRHPDRVGRLALLAPALAWKRARPLAPYLRLVRPELGLLQPVSRRVAERLLRAMIPGATLGWIAAGIDEFLRVYLTPRGRVAFYAAARHIYLERPDGPEGFWTRLGELAVQSLFVWGRQDQFVPVTFAPHVKRVLPGARHLELDCGHVPQLELPRETHAAIGAFLAGRRKTA